RVFLNNSSNVSQLTAYDLINSTLYLMWSDYLVAGLKFL
ncbi:MAG: hypothetical protein ACI9A7_002551, partial [Cyclobacteriaceae bacterium]